MRFNPVSFVSVAFFLLALLCAWFTRRDLESGTTRWCAWSRLAAPLSRWDSPLRYWLAMAANIAVVILFTLVGVFAMRVGLLRLIRP